MASSSLTQAASAASTAATSLTAMTSSNHRGLSGGKIAGIVVGSVIGGLLLIGLLLLGAFLLWRRQRKAKKENVDFVGEKNHSIDSSPSENTGAARREEMANAPRSEDPTKYMTDPNANERSVRVNEASIITPAHEAGIRTARDVKTLPGHVTAGTMRTAMNIGDIPVNKSTHAVNLTTAESGACQHYAVANP